MTVENALQYLLSILILPILSTFISFAWGTDDPAWLYCLKRAFLLLPILAIILGYWVSVVSVLSLLIRGKKQIFFTAVLATWWDLGRAILMFWAGIFKFLLAFGIALFSVFRIIVVGLWVLIHDIVFIPFRVMLNIANSVLNPGVPWIAVILTVFWCLFEAMIFTYVTSPLVIDTLSNMTGNQISESFIQIPLYLFMLFIVLGSYSVLSTWADAIKTKNIPSIIKIGAIEAVALFVEVMFLYREFVDALVPWFAQHSAGRFDLGITGTLMIAMATWFGIRSLSWFLFAASGTPTIMAIIQGSGLKVRKGELGATPFKGMLTLSSQLISEIKSEGDWVKKQGDELLGAVILPPLQVVAAAINFCTLFVTTRHLFELPIRDLNEIKNARSLLEGFEEKPTRKGG